MLKQSKLYISYSDEYIYKQYMLNKITQCIFAIVVQDLEHCKYIYICQTLIMRIGFEQRTVIRTLQDLYFVT